MPDGQVCKSKTQGNFYSLSTVMNPANGIKMDAAAAWYASHLSGFKKIQGYEDGRSQIAFYNADGTLVILLTGQVGAQGENTDAYTVAYERYQPGLSEKTITRLNARKIRLQVIEANRAELISERTVFTTRSQHEESCFDFARCTELRNVYRQHKRTVINICAETVR